MVAGADKQSDVSERLDPCSDCAWNFMVIHDHAAVNVYLLIYKPDSIYLFSLKFIWNAWFHCQIDHAKCNDHVINLIADQAMHMLQIVLTFGYFLIIAL